MVVDVPALSSVRAAVESGKAASIGLNLFDDAEFVALFDRASATPRGFSISGAIAGHPGSTATVVVNGRVAAGVFNTGARTFTLSYHGSQGHSVVESAAGFECGAGETQSTAGLHRKSAASGPLANAAKLAKDGAEVDVLFLYSPAARRQAGGLNAIRANVDLALATANEALQRSGADVRFTHAGSVEVAYNEAGFDEFDVVGGLQLMFEDLRRLRDVDQYLEAAHVLRDSYAADIVHLIVDHPGTGGGSAYISINEDEPSQHAFSVSNGTAPALVAHELGHVMGLRHDRYDDPGNEPYPYSHGYVNQRAFDAGAPVEKRWSTIMATQNQCIDADFQGPQGHCPHVLRYSNPNQLHPQTQDPLGVAGDSASDAHDGPADAVRSLNNTYATVVAFRDRSSRCEYRLSSEEVVVDATGGAFEVGVTAVDDCAWEARAADGFLEVTAGISGSGEGRVEFQVAANEGGARIGYLVVAGETLTVKQRGGTRPISACERSPHVRDGIVAAAGRPACEAVEEFDLVEIAHLNLGSRGIPEVRSRDFDGLVNLSTLDLSRNNIRKLPPGVFERLGNLKTLDVSWNSIERIQPGLFSDLATLQELRLQFNDIKEISRDLFKGLNQLAELHLHSNRLTRLPGDVFADQGQLAYLSLGFNDIDGAGLHRDVFRGLDKLLRLDLSGNPLGDSLPQDLYAHLKSLVQIYLSDAQLSTVPRFYNDMAWVDVDRNRIASLEGVRLSGQRILHLNLANNELLSVPDGFFEGYSSVHCRTRNFQLNLRDNPGAPFVFRLELVRTDAPPAAPGPATVAVRLPSGAPLPLTAGLSADGGTLSADTITIENGVVEGSPVEVQAEKPVTLRLLDHGSLQLPVTYKGIRVELGSPLRLFALDDTTLESGMQSRLDLAAALSRPGEMLTDIRAQSSDGGTAAVSLTEGVLTLSAGNTGTATITVSARNEAGMAIERTFTVTVIRAARLARTVPFFPSAEDGNRQGFARIINHSDQAGEVRIDAFDDMGVGRGTLTLTLAAGQTAQFNSDDMVNGNSDKGLLGRTETGDGDWRLEVGSDLDIEVLSYIRTRDGFLTAMHDIVPVIDGMYRVAIFNPGSNLNQVSHLRLINRGTETAQATIEGIDDEGSLSAMPVSLSVPAGFARIYTAGELETGGASGLEGSLGSGVGKWRLRIGAPPEVVAMSLLSSPTGHLTNLSSIPRTMRSDAWAVPLFPAVADPFERQGFVRVINRSGRSGEVDIEAYDATNREFEALSLEIGAGQTVHFNSGDLETGNSEKGLQGSTGPGEGHWRLRLASDLDLQVLSYVRTRDGFLTAMHEVAPNVAEHHRIAIFNPGSNSNQVSLLRLINSADTSTVATVRAIDDAGRSGGTVRIPLPARTTRTLSAQELESGAAGVNGAFGDGKGKWRIDVESDRPITVMSLLSSPTGHLTNLSAASLRRTAGQ